jgi:transposase
MLETDARRPQRDRRTALKLFAQLQTQGFDGDYSRVTEFIRRWKAEGGASVTKAFEQQMLLELINSTLEDVSLKHAIGVDALQGILDRRIEPEVDWNGIETLEVIGIDEIALKKGHRDFVVVISAYVNDRLRVIALLPARNKAAVEAFFHSIPKRLRRTVAVVCSDLYQGFIGAAKAVFGKRVLICADRRDALRGDHQLFRRPPDQWIRGGAQQ